MLFLTNKDSRIRFHTLVEWVRAASVALISEYQQINTRPNYGYQQDEDDDHNLGCHVPI